MTYKFVIPLLNIIISWRFIHQIFVKDPILLALLFRKLSYLAVRNLLHFNLQNLICY